jgi:hypothetical protein
MSNPIQTTVRIPEPSEQIIQEIMFETNKSRSLVLRAMLAIAGRHQEEVVTLLQEQL